MCRLYGRNLSLLTLAVAPHHSATLVQFLMSLQLPRASTGCLGVFLFGRKISPPLFVPSYPPLPSTTAFLGGVVDSAADDNVDVDIDATAASAQDLPHFILVP